MNRLGFGSAFITATICLAAGVVQPAVACSLVKYADNGRYVGGNLVPQIAAKADLIQLVRVTEQRVVTRTYSLGSWYLSYGDTDIPDQLPEYVDHFVFTLEAVDTLKGSLRPEPWLIEDPLRIAGYDLSVFASGAYPVPPESAALHPNRLPEWVFDRPADDGYAFIPASEDAGLGSGECASPYFLEVGQLFVALRRSDGRLYPSDGAFPLEIDAQFRWQSGRTERHPLRIQSLVPISGLDDPFVQSLRAAITSGG